MAGKPPDEQDVTIGRRIVASRKAAKVTQKAAGDLIGVSATQVQKYESGANHISARNLFTFSQHFDVPITAFFEGLPLASGGQFGEERQANYVAEDPWADLVGALLRVLNGFDPATRSRIRTALKDTEERLKR